MLDMMEGTEEYNNMGALYGLDGLDGDELLGALRKMDPVTRAKTMNALSNNPTPSRGSRAEMEKHFGELPEPLAVGIVYDFTDQLCQVFHQVNYT